jgi:hypothetical protein
MCCVRKEKREIKKIQMSIIGSMRSNRDKNQAKERKVGHTAGRPEGKKKEDRVGNRG